MRIKKRVKKSGPPWKNLSKSSYNHFSIVVYVPFLKKKPVFQLILELFWSTVGPNQVGRSKIQLKNRIRHSKIFLGSIYHHYHYNLNLFKFFVLKVYQTFSWRWKGANLFLSKKTFSEGNIRIGPFFTWAQMPSENVIRFFSCQWKSFSKSLWDLIPPYMKFTKMSLLCANMQQNGRNVDFFVKIGVFYIENLHFCRERKVCMTIFEDFHLADLIFFAKFPFLPSFWS